MSISFSAATNEDLPDIRQLLNRCGLPADDVAEHLDHFLVARSNGMVIGTVGLEMYGSAALLRSLAVEETHRAGGLGKALYSKAERYALDKGVREISLLTTTAEQFFEKRGFQKVEQKRIAEYVRQTKEYRLFCPSTAVCMWKQLEGSG